MTFFCCKILVMRGNYKKNVFGAIHVSRVCEMYSSSDDDDDFSTTPSILKKWAEEVRNKRKRTCKFIK